MRTNNHQEAGQDANCTLHTTRGNTEVQPLILPTLLNSDFLSRAAHPPINQGPGQLAARRLSAPLALLCIYQGVEAFSHLVNLMVSHGVE